MNSIVAGGKSRSTYVFQPLLLARLPSGWSGFSFPAADTLFLCILSEDCLRTTRDQPDRQNLRQEIWIWPNFRTGNRTLRVFQSKKLHTAIEIKSTFFIPTDMSQWLYSPRTTREGFSKTTLTFGRLYAWAWRGRERDDDGAQSEGKLLSRFLASIFFLCFCCGNKISVLRSSSEDILLLQQDLRAKKNPIYLCLSVHIRLAATSGDALVFLPLRDFHRGLLFVRIVLLWLAEIHIWTLGQSCERCEPRCE